jgi:hypothetical protein
MLASPSPSVGPLFAQPKSYSRQAIRFARIPLHAERGEFKARVETRFPHDERSIVNEQNDYGEEVYRMLGLAARPIGLRLFMNSARRRGRLESGIAERLFATNAMPAAADRLSPGLASGK